MIKLTDATQAAMVRVATAPRTSEQGQLQPTFHTTPDGEIRIQLGRLQDTVSSWHLVPVKIRQLRRLLFSTPTAS
jgi:hypothetical protein